MPEPVPLVILVYHTSPANDRLCYRTSTAADRPRGTYYLNDPPIEVTSSKARVTNRNIICKCVPVNYNFSQWNTTISTLTKYLNHTESRSWVRQFQISLRCRNQLCKNVTSNRTGEYFTTPCLAGACIGGFSFMSLVAHEADSIHNRYVSWPS